MSKIDEVRKIMMEAMKAKDKDKKDAASELLTALKNAAIDKREDLTEEEENSIVKKEIRILQETIDTAPAAPRTKSAPRSDACVQLCFRFHVPAGPAGTGAGFQFSAMDNSPDSLCVRCFQQGKPA